ncbi:hydralysin-like [Anneissia japonica]|uniref:hydralysin-like n=1 Tax=Anneissia japonica TaxID=1529436 RepID=UPI0014254CD7|nr:hydralysin-like [Anneissia japonica]
MESALSLRKKAILPRNTKLTMALILALATCNFTCYAVDSDSGEYANSTLSDEYWPATTEYSRGRAATTEDSIYKAAPDTEETSNHTRNTSVNIPVFSAFSTKIAERTKQLLSFDDLPALSSSPNEVSEAFKEEFGVQPAGIALNDQTFFDAVKPTITEQYGNHAYIKLIGYEFTYDKVSLPEKVIIGKKEAVNKADTTAQISLSIRGEWDEATSYSSFVTRDLTIENEVTIKGIFQISGGSFSVSVTAGKSESTSSATSFEATVTAEVPPKSKVEVSMVGYTETEEVGFRVPIEVDGWFGANFESPVKDHYFWFMSADKVLPKTIGEISGVIKHGRLFNTKTYIEEAVPI